MAGNGRTFVIAGAGIAGLTLALALAKFGATVTVFEHNADIQEFGAGLQISPNARKVLHRLGVERYLTRTAFEPDCIDIYPFQAKKPVLGMRMGAAIHERFGAPYVVMHRADLAKALHQACRRFANIDIVFGTDSIDLEQHQKGVTVSAQSRTAGHRTARPFAFVGADGVHSQTRTEFLGGAPARYTGYIAWRTLIDTDKLAPVVNLSNTSLFLGPGYHAVLYPLTQRKKINAALFTRAPEKEAREDAEPGKPRISRWHRDSKSFRAIVEAGGTGWTRWPLYSVNEKNWFDGSVGLMGDAAHAMLPFQAQGAAMAIEDAAILAPLLMTEPSAAAAFSHFRTLRADRVAKVAKLSARNGSIFHMRWPGSFVRDMVMWTRSDTAHISQLAWLYGYDPAPEPDTPAPVQT